MPRTPFTLARGVHLPSFCGHVASLRSFRRFWCFTAIVVMVQMIVVHAMAVHPHLHECCHDHAHETDHQCIVTIISSGCCNHSLPDIVPVTVSVDPPEAPIELPQVESAILPDHLAGGLLAHAPPRGP